MSTSSAQFSPRKDRRRDVLGRTLTLAILAIAVVALFIGPGDTWLTAAFVAIEGSGTAGMVAYVALFVLATIILVPGSLLTVVAGFLFGVTWGFLLVTMASLLAALATLGVGRYIARDVVYRRLAARPRLRLLLRAIEDNGTRAVFFARIVPFIPYNLLNYALSLTHVRWRPYAVGTVLGMIPGSLTLVYIGAATGDLSRAMTGIEAINGASGFVYLLTALAIVLVTWWLSRWATRELNAMMSKLEGQEPLLP
jgi:uncharacterized membrane protein YdjX (TVP38/TMEM64 family)